MQKFIEIGWYQITVQKIDIVSKLFPFDIILQLFN